MSTKILLSSILIILIYNDISAQVGFGERQIILQDVAYGSIHSADIDGDGHVDIISQYSDNGVNELNWHKNIDGEGLFEKKIIYQTNETFFIKWVNAVDIDGDGDLDIIASGSNIKLFKNIDGQGNFSAPIHIYGPIFYGLSCVDIDNDGDIDIVTGTNDPGYEGVSWFENIDGEGNFGPEQIIYKIFIDQGSFIEISCFDLDEDGDMDILYTSQYGNNITWFPNLGSANFGSPQIITTTGAGIPKYLKINDIDGDNDLDILYSGYTNDIIFWCENLNNSNLFGDKQIIHQGSNYSKSFPGDIDKDGDIDMILMYEDQDGIFWHENIDGHGSFGTLQTISSNEPRASRIYATDIDNDNDPDLFVISSIPYTLSWYENTSVLSLNIANQSNFSVYPIPVSDILYIKSESKIQLLRIFNSRGQIILSKSNDGSINLSELNQGLYFIEIEDVNGKKEFKKIIKQ